MLGTLLVGLCMNFFAVYAWNIIGWAMYKLFRYICLEHHQRWSRGHKARGQGQGHKKNPSPRPRTAFPRTDTLKAKDRNARGQGQGPRTQAQVFSKKKKVFTKIFQAISTKRRFSKNEFFRYIICLEHHWVGHV